MFFLRIFSLLFLFTFSTQSNALEIKETEQGGQEIWYSENSLNPIISIRIAFKNSGTAYDPEDKLGLANFVTAMLNEGAGDIGSEEFLQSLDDNSIKFRPSADLDNFYISIKTLGSNIDLALNLVNLAITQPSFEEEAFERVKKQVLTGLKKKSESASDVALVEFKSRFYAGHEYAKNSDGSLQTVGDITAQDMHDFVKRNFTKDNFVIGVSGDVSKKSVQEITTKIMANLPEKSTQNKLEEFANYPLAEEAFVERSFPQTVIMFGKKGISRSEDDFYTGYLLNHIFGGSGFQSRLYKEVREKRGLTYYSGSSMRDYDAASIVLGTVATQAAKRDEAVSVIQAELEKIGREGISAEELESAKKYVIGAYPFSLDSSSALASHIVSLQLDGLPIDYAEQRDKFFSEVDLKKANDLARDWFGKDSWYFLSVGNAQ